MQKALILYLLTVEWRERVLLSWSAATISLTLG